MSHHKPDPNKSVNLTIDGIPVTVPEGTTILDAARKANIHIPTLCDHPDLRVRAVCRLCVVECDGRGKLAAACANDVWEGVSIVTHNERIDSIRKMIIELVLANHPQECLSCIRNTNCELQSLAKQFGIRETPFRRDDSDHKPPVTESKTLVRDMDKCVKCGRCVEVCQEVQAIGSINTAYRSIHYEISAPYGQALVNGACVFCGHCAAVCPVGAIYEYDQSAETWAALRDTERRRAVQILPSLTAAFDAALGLSAGTVNAGKLVTALKRLGFDTVFDAQFFEDAATGAEHTEVLNRINKGGKLPLISGYSDGCIKFVENAYPDLGAHLSPCKNPRQTFAALIKTAESPTTAVSISVGIADKFRRRQSPTDVDIVLSVNELARMFKLAGIDFAALPETPFDRFTGTAPQATPVAAPEPAVAGNYKTLTINNFAHALTVMDSIRAGTCDAALVRIST